MIRSRTLVAPVVLLAVLLAPEIVLAAGQFKGRCEKVHDGDTISVMHDGHLEVVRLEGIDAPELDQECGVEAREHLSALILGRVVVVTVVGTNKYERTLGRVHRGRSDINLRLVRDGWAWHYLEYSHEKALADAEQEARRLQRGLWATPQALPPWEFRHNKHSPSPPLPPPEPIPATQPTQAHN